MQNKIGIILHRMIPTLVSSGTLKPNGCDKDTSLIKINQDIL